MLTVKFGNIDLSRIGFGSRRLPLNEEGLINVPMVEAMVDYSMEKGVNFFNTGYTYHKMQAEGIIIKALSKYPRNTYFLA
ncbi:MAG: aldo/keto reductase, partial [Elusimicrobiales bacterium]|nr:aldo/keto reductase [Elusimicrobiales bacterium]